MNPSASAVKFLWMTALLPLCAAWQGCTMAETKPTSPIATRDGIMAAQAAPKPVEITISAVGDLMCAGRQFQLAHTEGDDYDFFPSFQVIRPLLEGADLTLGNFETNVAGLGAGYRGFPRFNTPDDYVNPLREAGFDMLFTSNNHAMDNGEAGIRRTLRVLDEHGLGHTGTFENTDDRDSVRFAVVKGIRIALLSYTSTTNGIAGPAGKPYLVNYIHFPRMRADIQAARQRGAEIVLTYFHFGTEYTHDPNWWQETVVAEAISSGADIILGSHPHVVQPVKFFKPRASRLDSGVVCFSLGNFLANEFRNGGDAGVVMNMRIRRDQDSLRLTAVDYVPTWTYRGTNPEMQRHIILPAEWGFSQEAPFPYLHTSDLAQMRRAFDNTRQVLTRYSTRPQVRGMLADPGGLILTQDTTPERTLRAL